MNSLFIHLPARYKLFVILKSIHTMFPDHSQMCDEWKRTWRVGPHIPRAGIKAVLCLLVKGLLSQTVKRLPTMRETRVQSLGQEDLLEKEMVTHSSILAWRIPWSKKPGRLQAMGSQRVGHDWATSLHSKQVLFLEPPFPHFCVFCWGFHFPNEDHWRAA